VFVEIELESPDSTSVSEIAPPDQPIVDRFVPFPSATARSRNVAVIFGQKHPGPASGKLTGPFTQVLAVKHENQSDHQLNEKSQDLLYTNV